jgi:hypothetical protein
MRLTDGLATKTVQSSDWRTETFHWEYRGRHILIIQHLELSSQYKKKTIGGKAADSFTADAHNDTASDDCPNSILRNLFCRRQTQQWRALRIHKQARVFMENIMFVGSEPFLLRSSEYWPYLGYRRVIEQVV